MSEAGKKYGPLLAFIRELYRGDRIPLHEPRFLGNEKRYLMDCIDSTFVSSVGAYVDRFEEMMCGITGARHAIATSNGTASLHIALLLSGVERGEEVITQPLSFVASCNAISYLGARPVFVDVDRDSLSLSPVALRYFLEENGERRNGSCYNRRTGNRIAAVLPMHTFGLPGRAPELLAICAEWSLPLVEDAAESLGSTIGNKHTGTLGRFGSYSFNGNKTVTSGGGGCIVTDDEALARRAKHLTTTAKSPHAWDFYHDEIGYNYRLPNLNAALACAQLEQLDGFLENKRQTANAYADFCKSAGLQFLQEREGTRSNYWLNGIVLESRAERDAFLQYSNAAGVMTRPIWTLLSKLPAFVDCVAGPLDNAQWLEDRTVNLPSSVRV